MKELKLNQKELQNFRNITRIPFPKACKRQVSRPLMTSFVVFAIQFPDLQIISALFIIRNAKYKTKATLMFRYLAYSTEGSLYIIHGR